jgi:tetratricopeptide (TPR) repeat protein
VIHDTPDTLSARRGVRQIASLVALDMTDLAALAQLDAIVEDSPGTESRATLSEIYCEAAQALGRKGPTAEAATALEEALRFSSPGPARAEITLSLAETLLQLGRYKQVHPLLAGLVTEPALSLLDSRQRAEYLDALAYHGDGDMAEARAILERIVAAPGPHPCRDGAERLLEHLRPVEGQ